VPDPRRVPLYPLRFAPILQYRVWGGRRLADLLATPVPAEGHVGEAWLLSDRPDHQSHVAAGPLTGRTLRQLLEDYPEQMMGDLVNRFPRFPLLLKFLDAHDMLSVQVHPSDHQTDCLPPGESGKTEAWVVLEAGPESHIYAGLAPGSTPDGLRQARRSGTLTDHLVSFTPKVGDVVFLPAGTVHTLGGNIVAFEIQQNSDVTFRLYDWDRVDPTTGRGRSLDIARALACIDFNQGAVGPVTPRVDTTVPVTRERLVECEYFSLWRVHGQAAFTVGAPGAPRVLICVAGAGQIEHQGAAYAIATGDVVLLPAAVGACVLRPSALVTVLEAALPLPSTLRDAGPAAGAGTPGVAGR
jgi:mannose-6-phosphate isomerase